MRKIEFDFCLLEQYEKENKTLELRLSAAKTKQGTRQYHCFRIE